jgi:hypothetical protein
MRLGLFNAAFLGIGVGVIFLVFAIGNANHSRSFQTASEKALCITTIWAVPIAICLAASLASIPFKRRNERVPYPFLQAALLVAVPVILFTPVGQRMPSGHMGDLAIFMMYALAVASLAACVRNVVVAVAQRQIARAATNTPVGFGMAVIVVAGTSVFMFFE